MGVSQSIITPYKGAEIIAIPRGVYSDIIKHIKSEYPMIALGILVGLFQKNHAIVFHTVKLKNIKPSLDNYAMDEKEWMRRIQEANNLGLKYIGIYHSHRGSANPTQYDIQKMRECPGEIFLIIHAKKNKIIDIRAWKYGENGKGLTEVKILRI